MRFFRWIASIFKKPAKIVMYQPPTPNEVVGTPGLYLGKIMNASPDEAEMIKRAVNICEAVIRADYFKELILNSNFTSADGRTNEQIYEDYTTKAIPVNVAMFTGNWWQNHKSHTWGYDNNDEYVHANRYFVQDAMSLGSLILHETAHYLGYHHESADDLTSVPYSMNGFFDEVTKRLGITN
jgi:hypothetical protein